jgi:hypothetical protein
MICAIIPAKNLFLVCFPNRPKALTTGRPEATIVARALVKRDLSFRVTLLNN